MKKHILFFLILTGMISCGQSSADNDNAEPVKEDTVEVKENPSDSARPELVSAEEILIPVSGEHGSYGYQDSSGNWMIKPQFYFASEFSEGIAVVSLKGSEWEIVNRKGEILKTFDIAKFSPIVVHHELSGEDHVIHPTEGILPIEFPDGKFGYMELSSEKISKMKFDEVLSFSDGFAAVQIKGKFGYIGHDFNWVIQPKYDNAFMFSFNRAIVVLNGEFFILDKKVKIYNEKPFLSAFRFKEGLTFVSYSDKYMDYFIIDTMCNVIHKGPYEYIYNLGFENGECEVMKNGKCIIIDKKGKKIRDNKEGCQEGC